MENNGLTVVGVYEEREDAVREIQKLHNQGYRQDDIHVYSNQERARNVERLMGINVDDVDVGDVEEDTSWWDTIRNSFRFFAFYPDENKNQINAVEDPENERLPLDEETIRSTSDFLEPYKKDIAAGKLVIVVNNYKEPKR